MQNSKKILAPAALVGLAAGLSPFAKEAQGAVSYGNFVGPDVSYNGVTETDTQLPGPTPPQLFGTPTLFGDSLQFSPTNFLTGVSGGSVEFQDGKLDMSIAPTSTNSISLIKIDEGGGWGLVGGTHATSSQESLLINQLFITSVNGASVSPIVVTPTTAFTYTNSGTATVLINSNSIDFESNGGISAGTWNADATFNVAGALAGAGLSGKVTGLTLALDNDLASTSETNSTSFIDKKFFDVTTQTSVPEPSMLGLIVTAAGGMMLRRKREEVVTA